MSGTPGIFRRTAKLCTRNRDLAYINKELLTTGDPMLRHILMQYLNTLRGSPTQLAI